MVRFKASEEQFDKLSGKHLSLSSWGSAIGPGIWILHPCLTFLVKFNAVESIGSGDLFETIVEYTNLKESVSFLKGPSLDPTM